MTDIFTQFDGNDFDVVQQLGWRIVDDYPRIIEDLEALVLECQSPLKNTEFSQPVKLYICLRLVRRANNKMTYKRLAWVRTFKKNTDGRVTRRNWLAYEVLGIVQKLSVGRLTV